MSHSRFYYLKIVASILIITTGSMVTPIYANGDVFKPEDKTPKKEDNPCSFDDSIYGQFKVILNHVLTSTVVSDIEKQVKGEVPDKKEELVTTEVYIVTKTQWIDMYVDDRDGLPNQGSKDKIKKEAESIFDKNSAFTYTSDKLNSKGTQKIMIKIFCKDSLQTKIKNAVDGNFQLPNIYNLIIHELVHAKRYTIELLGECPTFKDHDEKFFEEIKRLEDELRKKPLPKVIEELIVSSDEKPLESFSEEIIGQPIVFLDPSQDPNCEIVGGQLLRLDTTSLILAGAQTFSWMIPVILSAIGIGLFIASRKSE